MYQFHKMKINAVSEFAQGMKAVGHDAPFDSVESSKSFFQTHNVVFTQFAQNNPAQPSFITGMSIASGKCGKGCLRSHTDVPRRSLPRHVEIPTPPSPLAMALAMRSTTAMIVAISTTPLIHHTRDQLARRGDQGSND
jgi:hypothetical protein